MKSLRSKVAALSAAAITTLGVANAAAAQSFGNVEVAQDDFVLVAAPGGGLLGRPQLMIIEQQRDDRPCWSEAGSAPTQVEPLLLEFDFSGICGRSTDSNGYSIRTSEGDAGRNFSFDIREENGEQVLYAVPSRFPTNPYREANPFPVGRTFGVASNGFTKIALNPGWRLTKRVYEGRTLGHVYLTSDTTLASIIESNGGPIVTDPGPSPTPTPTTSFSDVGSDIYVQQIARAVEVGFIAGFQDNTFRPTTALTREQLVSMVLEALDAQSNLSIALPNQVGASPFGDVPSNRWSAAKIQFASQAGIVTGYPDGSFRPAQEVTRAEMIAVLRRAAEYRKRLLNEGTTLNPTQTARSFSDTSGHWAAGVITDLSAYCGIATPLNESGSAFYPNEKALRNYAATAVVRLVDCSNP
ncbi:MAG: DUF3747 domain-containing protein [Cyanobacteria bacterium P01_A01_bin.105]